MPPKERRKGQKEIRKENLDTLRFYFKFCSTAEAIQLLHIIVGVYMSETFSKWNYFFVAFAPAVNIVAYQLLKSMAKPCFNTAGELLDAGTDLNDAWTAEYAKDVIILTSGLQALSAVTNYVWLLWFLFPGYVLYKLWIVVLWPWFQTGPQDTVEPKKQKTRTRKT